MDWTVAVRALVVAPIVLWLPGHLLARLLVPTSRGIPRFAIAIVLSISAEVVMLMVGDLLFSIPIGGIALVSYALVVSAASGAALLVLAKHRRGVDPDTT